MTELVQLEIEQSGELVVARLTGELDIADAAETGDSIEAAVPGSARGVVADFSGLEFIDSSGVAMLFALARRLASRRQELSVVARPGEAVARVLELVELDRVAPVFETLDEALAELSPRG